MPTYKVLRDTWISHEGRLVREGETVKVDWPKGCAPAKLGSNLELVKGEKAEAPKPEGSGPSLA